MFIKNRSGFTLIELMITVAVIVVSLFGILYTNTTMQQVGQAAFERTVAVQHANQIIERMRDASNSGLNNVTTTFANNGTVATSNYTSSANELLNGEQIVVTYVSTSADPLDATVTVTWQALGKRATSLALRTLITKRS